MTEETIELVNSSIAALSEDGSVANKIVDFKVRSGQQKMATAVAEAIIQQSDLIVEAGTGIGKTFAYLVPALLSGKRTIVSTATRHLQDQIYFRDLPTVIGALDVKRETALLKGRANYLCVERLKRATQQSTLDSGLADKIHLVERWSYQSDDGDISLMPHIAEDDSLWPLLTSTVDNCLRKKCEHYDSCYVFDARQKAADADLVVVNHALLMADMTLKEEGFADLLPEAELIIVDEAHRLKDFAEQSFTESFNSRMFVDLLNEIGSLLKEEKKQPVHIAEQICLCNDSIAKLTALMRGLHERAPIETLRTHRSFNEHYSQFAEQSNHLAAMLKPYKTISEQWENCIQRLKNILDFIALIFADTDKSDANQPAAIAWFQCYQHSFQIHLSPIDVSALLIEKSKQYDTTWVYASATLSVDGDFSYFLPNVANDDKACKSYDSPFDYQSQVALYLPNDIPHPQHQDYTRRLINGILPLLSMSEGRTFLLFTSYRALHEAEALLDETTDYTLLVQNQATKSELIERFTREHKAVLLGTSGFWSGVDVKGDALRCVVIDRLPFAPPSDPLMQARKIFYENCDRDFFREYVLPEAVIALRQGVGRLIRSESDCGVIVIGDPRLRQKGYGHIFMRSLPAMKHCKDIASLAAYLK
ncbi:MAG: ATP-dependent DNA helicase [Chromatiales bacterium]|nr:ATP-dependent DNA helicase [Chromatiales bacterium]